MPTIGVTPTGLVNGDVLGSLAGTLGETTTATSASDVGGYSVTPNGLTSTNYTITFAPGTLTVTPAPLTITAVAQSKVYQDTLPELSVTYSPFVLGQDSTALGGTLGETTLAMQSSGVGTYQITPNGLTSTNYAHHLRPGQPDGDARTADPHRRRSDQGLRPGQPRPDLHHRRSLRQDDVTANITDAASQFSDVNALGYGITLAGLGGTDASNYSVESVTGGTLTVTPAPLTVITANATKVYGQVNPTTTGVVTGALNGDVVGITYSSDVGQFSDVNADGYAITPIALTGAKAVDYSLADVTPGTLTITPAPLAIAVTSLTKVYGQANPALTGNVAGIVNGDDVTPLYATSATTTSGVISGGYGISITGLAGSKVGDYFVLESNPGHAHGHARAADDHGQLGLEDLRPAAPNLSASYSGFVLGQGPADLAGTLSVVTTATAASHVGIYPIIPGGQSSANYAIDYEPAPLANFRALLVVTAPNVTKVYGQAVPSLSVSYSGFVNGESPASLTSPVTLSRPRRPRRATSASIR